MMLTSSSVGAEATEAMDDPYLWLEDVEGDAALAWVKEQNERTLAYVQRHGDTYESLYERLLTVLASDEGIAYPRIAGDHIYNFWMDASHPRGLWRRTTLESYIEGEAVWEDLLDVADLAEAEGVNWTFAGATCFPPAYERCLVSLSRGGSDTTEIREFDVRNGAFVPDGFFLPEAKNAAVWIDENSLLAVTDWGDGSLTTSGYPRIAKRIVRGEPLSEAVTVFEAESTDMGVSPMSISLEDEYVPLVVHATNFYERRYYFVRDAGLVPLDIPSDADWLLVADQLVILLRSDWHVGNASYEQGSVIAAELDAFLNGKAHFTPVFVPTDRIIVHDLAATADHLLVSVLNNVSSEVYRIHYERGPGGDRVDRGEHGSTNGRQGRLSDGKWVAERVPIPEFGGVDIVSASRRDNRAFLVYSNYLQPSTLYLLENDGSVRQLDQLPDMFDRAGLVVDQYEAISADGTAVPYFVVRREDLAFDGSNPTLLYGYGGFEESLTPVYTPTAGAAWLEGNGQRGGVYVVANIRGGGEFGPEWHRAALRENRQRAFDDFIAVAEDLIERGITSPQHLGIMGESNGGLLTGVAFTQRPDLFGAVVSAVPLLDMRRYHKLLAGASWMAEYGDPDLPEDWAFISRYSPYHNVHPDRSYPPVLFTTSTRDDRVHPGHARKMAAKMESMGHPVYYYESIEGGHGGAVTPEQQAQNWALIYTYLWGQLE